MAFPSSSPLNLLHFTLFLVASSFIPQAASVAPENCSGEEGACIDRSRALPLKIIAIASILTASLIGVSAPLFSRSIPALRPDRDLFVIVKVFASGIILATGFMHVLPDSFDMLTSACLPENPWHKFPFSGFVAMVSAIVTLMVDSLATSVYSKKMNTTKPVVLPSSNGSGNGIDHDNESGYHFHGAHHFHGGPKDEGAAGGSELLRYRVVAMVRFPCLLYLFYILY